MQLLERRVLPHTSRLQLVGHRGGSREHQLWGLQADLHDAFDEWAPDIALAFDPADVDADIVVMLAGATVPTDAGAAIDREALARENAALFHSYADALAARDQPPFVVMQSNPVELGVRILADALGDRQVLGAGAWSDSLRFAHEIADDLDVNRRDVFAYMLGMHGDNLVPLWSRIDVRGMSREEIDAYIARTRGGHTLAELPERIRAAKAQMIAMIQENRLAQAHDFVTSLPADLRAAIKPFFTHFTAGHTTEAVTARAAADIVAALVAGASMALPAQVQEIGRAHV